MPLIQIKLINGEPMGRPCNPYPEYFLTDSESGLKQIHNTHHVQFEQSVTYHHAPGLSESDGVEAVLQWQYKHPFDKNWQDEPIHEPYFDMNKEHEISVHQGKDTRQIWRLSPSQKVEVKEVDNFGKWINVAEDHLPSDKQEILFILKKSGDMRKGTYYTFDQWDREQMFVGDGYHNASTVTHWMPLPEKPTK